MNRIVMGHRSKPFTCNVICVFFDVETIDGFRNLVRCSHLRSQFPVVSVCFLFARHGCVLRSFQCSSRIFEGFSVFMVILDQQSRFLSVVELCRVLASRFSILAFLDSERLSQFGSTDQATHTRSGLVVARIFASLSPDHIYPLGGSTFNGVISVTTLLVIRGQVVCGTKLQCWSRCVSLVSCAWWR